MCEQLNVEYLPLKIGQSASIIIYVPNFYKNYGNNVFSWINPLYVPVFAPSNETLLYGVLEISLLVEFTYN